MLYKFIRQAIVGRVSLTPFVAPIFQGAPAKGKDLSGMD
jgi:hypothetical protein